MTDAPVGSPGPRASWVERLTPHVRGHLFAFGSGPPNRCDAAAGACLVLIFVVMEWLIGPRLELLRWAHLPVPPGWIRVPALLALALLLVRVVARIPLSGVGFRRWGAWNVVERSYFLQAVVIAHVVFFFIAGRRLRVIAGDRRLWGAALLMLLTQLAWGVYQELMYRGILQTALVSRWGRVAGMLVANTAFTFGPLHFYHFASASPLPMFAAIFVIGAFFSLLFQRSGNLWMVGILHGLGNVYLDGVSQLVR